MTETGFQIENPMKPASILLLERTASRNLHKSAPRRERDPRSGWFPQDPVRNGALEMQACDVGAGRLTRGEKSRVIKDSTESL